MLVDPSFGFPDADARCDASSGSAPVVIDDLDIVSVGVEHERAVIAGVVDLSLTRSTVVRIARGEGSAVKGVNRLSSDARNAT